MKALLDTNILIAGDDGADPPDLRGFAGLCVSSVSYSELASGVVISTGIVRARRRARLNALRATFGAGLSYDDACVEEFSLLTELVVSNGGSHRAHVLDRMIAATARAHGLVLVTRNIKDFRQIQDAIEIEVR